MQLLQYMSNMYDCRFRTAPHSNLNERNAESTKHQVLCVAAN